jgi:pSer/pThr/pTyr-binding forkhead associated (FHA) protein
MTQSSAKSVKVVLSKRGAGMDDFLSVLEVGGEPARIGRAEDSALRILDRTVSRHQAELRLTEDGDLIVVDAGSLNGTRLNRGLVSRRPIHLVLPGDVLTFGYAPEIRVIKVVAEQKPRAEGEGARLGEVA